MRDLKNKASGDQCGDTVQISAVADLLTLLAKRLELVLSPGKLLVPIPRMHDGGMHVVKPRRTLN